MMPGTGIEGAPGWVSGPENRVGALCEDHMEWLLGEEPGLVASADPMADPKTSWTGAVRELSRWTSAVSSLLGLVASLVRSRVLGLVSSLGLFWWCLSLCVMAACLRCLFGVPAAQNEIPRRALNSIPARQTRSNNGAFFFNYFRVMSELFQIFQTISGLIWSRRRTQLTTGLPTTTSLPGGYSSS